MSKKAVKSVQKYISVKGATLHNLKDISVDIPRNKLTIITGLSGSGKSTLAFDTIYAEGQRRFVESLSSYARQFLERMGKPEVESIDGLPPAIAIEQKPPSKNPRSTVGTNTEIYDYMRLLFGRIGKTLCRSCGDVVKKDNAAIALNEIVKFPEGSKMYIMFSFKNDSSYKPEYVLGELKEKGFFRLVDRKNFDIVNIDDLDISSVSFIEKYWVLGDRIIVNNDKDNKTRMADSLESAFVNGDGRVYIYHLKDKSILKFSSLYECPDCDILYQEPEPKLFSFNNPFGACPSCQGFGRTIGIDEDLVIPDRSRSLEKGAIHPFRTQSHAVHLRALMRIAHKYNMPTDVPINSLSPKHMETILEGRGAYIGVYGFFAKLEEKNYKVQNRVMLSRYRGYTKCKSCNGSRLRTSSRQVFIGDKNIPELVDMPLGRLLDFFENLKLTDHEMIIAGQILNELIWRLTLLVDIGLDYLTLSRLSHTLSGGESQRINLSTALGSSLVGTLYVLDEPSIGMHQSDTQRLIKIIYRLRDLGNTIIVVEHDPDIIRVADHIIDIGPKAGELGGEVMHSGDFKSLLENEKSETGLYLSGKKKINYRAEIRDGNGKSLTILNPKQNNLKMDKVTIPLGCLTLVTGVSGSGKSTLIHDILYAGLMKYKGGYNGLVGKFEKIIGADYLQHVEMVDQSSIGKSSRSTPATYTKAFDAIRELYSQTQTARQLGWKPGYFSFNVPGGRCDVCEGDGIVTVDMQFLPDVQLECEVCKGTRYKRDIRNILHNGKSIVDVLNMTVDEALEFFAGKSKITKKLQLLQDVGLGYLRLGQPSTMLSGGESQRVKLANHLDTYKNSDVLFIFDEPTTGLHIEDISKLLVCFNRLVNNGHSVVVIEHNLHVISAADHIIDLGPGAGDKGGEIVAEGTPEKISKSNISLTGAALRNFGM